ncbi:MAG: ABC transporter permease [Planctomycetota bacterium]|jgi:ABC-type transport system involved in multi-copper enzyme maturation permease subunit
MVIHDRSYSRWTGDKSRPVRATAIITRAGLRRGISTLFRRKFPAIILILGAFGPFIFALGFLFVRHYILTNAGSFAPELVEGLQGQEITRMSSANAENVYGYMFIIQWPFVLLACVLLGSGLVAEDRRANALELYLSRPMSLHQYLFGRLATIATFVAAVTVIPAAILVLTQLSLNWTQEGEAARLTGLLMRTLAAGAVWVAVPSLLILATSSLCERARNAAIVFLGIIVLLEFVASNILVEVFGNPSFFLMQIGFNCRQVGAWLLGDTADIEAAVPVWQSAVVVAGWILGCITITWRRVKPVEIVA